MAPPGGQILVIPFHGQGHIFPSTELCKRLSTALNYKITLIIPSSLSTSLAPTTLYQIIEITPDHPPDSSQIQHHPLRDTTMVRPFTHILSSLSNGPDPPICAIVDVLLTWPLHPCNQLKIPTISFFTSGACSAAMMHAISNNPLQTIMPPAALPGLPPEMHLTYFDLNHRPPRAPPLTPGERHPWVLHAENSVALIVNTCDDLERPFLEYISKEMSKAVFSVGPLLPDEFWPASVVEVVRDRDMRTKRYTNVNEDEVKRWLESKARRSVVFVAFGTEVGPTSDELHELALALEESNTPFIWALHSALERSGPPRGPPPLGPPPPPPPPPPEPAFQLDEGFVKRVEGEGRGRGLIIRGWAPQLLILSHPSTAIFVSHCGWNSTLEALARGVPLLAWPIRGDQFFNAKYLVHHLKVGSMIKLDTTQNHPTNKEDILQGIQRLMSDEDSRKRATSLRTIFTHGFPTTSVASLRAFNHFLSQGISLN